MKNIFLKTIKNVEITKKKIIIKSSCSRVTRWTWSTYSKTKLSL